MADQRERSASATALTPWGLYGAALPAGRPPGNRRRAVIVAETGAIVTLIDGDDCHHGALRTLSESEPRR